MSLIVLCFLHNTSVLSFYTDVVLTLPVSSFFNPIKHMAAITSLHAGDLFLQNSAWTTMFGCTTDGICGIIIEIKILWLASLLLLITHRGIDGNIWHWQVITDSYDMYWYYRHKQSIEGIMNLRMKLLIHSQTGYTVEIWIVSNLIPHFKMDVIAYPCWD